MLLALYNFTHTHTKIVFWRIQNIVRYFIIIIIIFPHKNPDNLISLIMQTAVRYDNLSFFLWIIEIWTDLYYKPHFDSTFYWFLFFYVGNLNLLISLFELCCSFYYKISDSRIILLMQTALRFVNFIGIFEMLTDL